MLKRQVTGQSPRWIVLMMCCTAASAVTTRADSNTPYTGVTPWTSTDPTGRGMTSTTPGPIARAIAREAVRLGVEGRPGSRGPEWSRVRTVAPGSEIIVTVKGSPARGRDVVRVDAAGLTLLNLADAPLPAGVKAVLRDVATRHPDYFSAAQQGATFVLDRSVRLQVGGVFLGDAKMADFEQVVEHIARDDVAEIKTRQKGRGVWGHLGPLGGYFVGAMAGGVVAGLACQAAAGRDRCDSGAFLTGMLGGGIAGGVYGFRAANRETEDVIYRAP